jgi:hypothetical protein
MFEINGPAKLHNEETRNLNRSLNITRIVESRRLEGAEHVGCMGETSDSYGILLGKPSGERPVVRSRMIWRDNINLCIRKCDLFKMFLTRPKIVMQ